MGEKPLGIDEARAPIGTIAGGSPLGGVDVPPPAMKAGSISTTRSNIKNSGSAAASQLPKGLEPTPTRPGDPFPDKPPGPPGLAIKENGIKVDGGAAGAEGVGQTAEPVAMEGEPIPGIDTKGRHNPGGAASAAVPGAEVDDAPGGDEPDPMAGAASVVTTRSNIKNGGGVADAGSEGGGDVTPAGDAPGVAGGIQPIPGVDIVIKKNPPR